VIDTTLVLMLTTPLGFSRQISGVSRAPEKDLFRGKWPSIHRFFRCHRQQRSEPAHAPHRRADRSGHPCLDHSEIRVETDSNYGTIFSSWDRLFGSLRLREYTQAFRLGIGRFDNLASLPAGLGPTPPA
jgi:hypothetical protein